MEKVITRLDLTTNERELVIQGTYSGNLHQGIMEWVCPITDESRQSQGEFNCDGDYYYHRECTDGGELIYIVRAK